MEKQLPHSHSFPQKIDVPRCLLGFGEEDTCMPLVLLFIREKCMLSEECWQPNEHVGESLKVHFPFEKFVEWCKLRRHCFRFFSAKGEKLKCSMSSLFRRLTAVNVAHKNMLKVYWPEKGYDDVLLGAHNPRWSWWVSRYKKCHIRNYFSSVVHAKEISTHEKHYTRLYDEYLRICIHFAILTSNRICYTKGSRSALVSPRNVNVGTWT